MWKVSTRNCCQFHYIIISKMSHTQSKIQSSRRKIWWLFCVFWNLSALNRSNRSNLSAVFHRATIDFWPSVSTAAARPSSFYEPLCEMTWRVGPLSVWLVKAQHTAHHSLGFQVYFLSAQKSEITMNMILVVFVNAHYIGFSTMYSNISAPI